jgi:phage baseplate assembly protein W
MARDFQLAWACPHLTIEEVVQLGSDRRTLPTRQPVGNSGTVRILVNDDTRLFVPQSGLYSSADLSGAISGPFDLVSGEDSLTVETSLGTQTVSFGVQTAARFTTDQIIKRMLFTQFNVATVTNTNGSLRFSDLQSVGLNSFVRLSGTAAVRLGFGSPGLSDRQRGAQGQMLFPGWRLYKREDDIVNRYPKFDYPVKGNPIFKVTYTVPPSRCLRCGGTYVENDIRLDEGGQAILIQDENLLYQAALKILLTEKGSNPYQPWYGTQLKSRIGSKAISGVAALISEDVRRALARMQSLQEEQAKYQQVTLKERLYSVKSVQVYPHAQDPTTYMIDVTVQNAAASQINLSIVFTVPSVVALMGSNGLMLGPQPTPLQISTPSVLNLNRS